MKTTKQIITKLNTLLSDISFETGGILGSENNDIITNIIIDEPDVTHTTLCRYEPNVEFLNKHIDNWSKKNIIFKGIFHTHFGGSKSLSSADKNYIYNIMKNMPSHITYLYFPVFVLPQEELICYIAKKENETIKIYIDNLDII